MYTICRQLHPPTGAEHSIYCNFTSPYEKQLVVASVNELQVYKINQNAELSPKENPSKKIHCLECICSFKLFGNVISMDKVRLKHNTRDSLVLAFQEAKVLLLNKTMNFEYVFNV